MKREWYCIDLPETGYTEAWNLQGELVSARKKRIIDKDVVLLLEHPPVFTMGRRGKIKNLTVSQAFLQRQGIQVVKAERGGDITFHGPGQLVVYPIVDMLGTALRVVDYVNRLEEVMILAAADWGIKARRDSAARGVWVGQNKLGSVGIAVRRGICFHGMAFNVNTSLEPFSWIIPCGLKGVEMTSMERELSHKVSIDSMREAVKRHLEGVFNAKLVAMSLSELTSCLKGVPLDRAVSYSHDPA